MQPSPSAQSIGKPSTAASASGRRTRTVVVAREIPSTGSSTSTSAPTGTARAVSPAPSTPPLAAGLPRDPRTGKLSSYAALGGEADLELFERFLADKRQRPAPTAGDAKAGAFASPLSVRSPTKRRLFPPTTAAATTVSNNADGTIITTTATSSASAGAPGGSAPQNPNDAIEQNDARRRREAAVKHRKWLKSLPIHERLAYERQQNVLRRWQRINADWETFKARTAKRLGKATDELVMSRAAEYREQIEMYDALQRATPLADKVGGDIWLVSLRDDGTRYVPVGNIFSGLYCPIRESTRLQPRVRRPLDYLKASDPLAESNGEAGDDDEQQQTAGKPLSTLERRSLEALAKKKRRLRKQLEALFPHEVEASKEGHLRVDTLDLFEWAASSGSNKPLGARSESTRSLALPPVPETSTEANSARASSRSSQSTRSQFTSPRPVTVGPRLRLFAAAAGDAAANVVEAQDDDPPPSNEVSLAFYTDIGALEQQVVCVANTGSTSLHFHWIREDDDEDASAERTELCSHLTTAAMAPLDEPTRPTWTSISLAHGLLYPGETVEVVFSFQSKRPGLWLERWGLVVDPPTPRRAETATEGPSHARDGLVRLECAAVDNFCPRQRRARQSARIREDETTFFIEQWVRTELLPRIDVPESVRFPALDGPEAATFYEHHAQGPYDRVQYSPELMAQCRGLYEDAWGVLGLEDHDVAAAEQPPPAVGESPPSTQRQGQEPTVPFPRTWDQRLESLKELVVAADAKQTEAYVALKQKLVAEAARAAEEDDDDDEEDDPLKRTVKGLLRTEKQHAAETELEALYPHFHDRFRSLCLSGQTTPYSAGPLGGRLAERLLRLCAETPVVHGIATMMGSTKDQGCKEGNSEAVELLRPLLIRAIDEAIGADHQRERDFEEARRRFHGLALADKPSYHRLPQCLGDRLAPVILFQVDLDVANWYTLAKGPDGGDAGALLSWRLAEALVGHPTYLPPSLARVVDAVRVLLETLTPSTMSSATTPPTIVLLTELGTPPMTTAMKRLEMAEVAAVIEAAPADSGSVDAESVRLKHQKVRDETLSLKGLDVVLARGLEGTAKAEFCSSIAELEHLLRPREPMTRAVDGHNGGEGEGTSTTSSMSEQSDPTPRPPMPRVLLLEHLERLTRQVFRPFKPPSEDSAATAPTTPATSAAPTPAAADKKGAPPVKKPPTAAAATPPAAVPPAKAGASEIASADEPPVEVPPGSSLEMVQMQTLGRKLAACSDVLVVDTFPRSWWESTFLAFPAAVTVAPEEKTDNGGGDGTGGDQAEATTSSPLTPRAKSVLVGPRLAEVFATWRTLFQAPASSGRVPRGLAIIGGRGLERKLRLLDGLLEHVAVVYVVGELAMAVYRALHTKRLVREAQEQRSPPPRHAWGHVVAAVERLMQKAYRKRVEVLLPTEFVVGEVELDERELAGPQVFEDDEEEDDGDEEQEEDEDDDDDEDDPRKRKLRLQRAKAALEKPLVEPFAVDSWRRRGVYDGEVAVVKLRVAPSAVAERTWITITEACAASPQLLREVDVVHGPRNIVLSTGAEEDNDDDGGEAGEATNVSPRPTPAPDVSWTFRTFDIGPHASAQLNAELREHLTEGTGEGSYVVVNGTPGVVELAEFGKSTREILDACHEAVGVPDPARILVAGKTTAAWLQRIDVEAKRTTSLVSITTSRLNAMLPHVIETSRHAMLDAFQSS